MRTKMTSIIFALTVLFSSCQSSDYETISSEKFQELQKSEKSVVLDVRTPEEYAEGHIKNAVNLDYSGGQLEQALSGLDKSKTYLVYCRSGKRSANSCNIMSKSGLKVYNLNGGINGWTGEIVK